MNTSIWDSIYRGQPQQEPQSKRFAEVSAGVKQQISDTRGRVLLLGVTPFLSSIGTDLTAVDHNATIVKTRWPGNTGNRRAVIADWLQLPFSKDSFTTSIGDGSINALTYPEGVTLLYANLARVMLPGGKLVCRIYLRPDIGESVEDVAQTAWRGDVRSLVYFRIRLSMAIAGESSQPNVRLKSSYETFLANFPDRDRLATVTGWDRREIDKIDLYKTSADVFSFPTMQEAMSIIPREFSNARLVPVGTYELAERCPLLVMEKK